MTLPLAMQALWRTDEQIQLLLRLHGLACMCYFKGYLGAVASTKKRCCNCDKLQTCWISSIIFLAGRDCLSCACSPAPWPFSTPVRLCIRRNHDLWPLGWVQLVPGVMKEERGCPRDNLLSRAQSLQWCCWEALVTRSHMPQVLLCHVTWCIRESMSPNGRMLERNLKFEFTACGKLFRCTGLESSFKSLGWGKHC